ncbi:hypothetical protein PAT3040_06397, partial [Paenibacillus agaridevorans]
LIGEEEQAAPLFLYGSSPKKKRQDDLP